MTRSVRAPRSRAAVLAAVLATALLAACSGSDGGPTPPPRPTDRPDLVANGAVLAIAVAPDGTAYLGGEFTAIGPFTGQLVLVDPVSGAAAASHPPIAGDGRSLTGVTSAVADGRGGWYVAGWLATGSWASAPSVARVRGDGSLDPAFAASFDAAVHALAVGNGVVYVGGAFDHVGGATRRRLAALDAETGAVAAWDPMHDPSAIPGLLQQSTRGFVNALAVADGTIYAAGASYSNPASPSWIAALDPAGAVSTWHPAIDGHGVQALAVHRGTLYAGGQFTTVDGQPRTGLAAFDPAGVLSTWSVAAPDVRALAVVDDVLYAGGAFTRGVGASEHAGLMAFDPSGAPSSWHPGLDGMVSALAVSGGTLYVGGHFDRAGAARRLNLAAFDRTGALLPWNPGANGDVLALAVASGRLLAGGWFTSVGAAPRGGLAALDPDGRLTAWDPDGPATVRAPSGSATRREPLVTALALADDRVFAGGLFRSIGGVPRTGLAAFDLRGNVLAGTPALDGLVSALAAVGGVVYAGGAFSTADGVRRAGLVAFDPAGGGVLAFDPALAGPRGEPPTVHALAVQGTTLYVGGSFEAAGGAPRGCGAAFDAAGALLPWDPHVADSSVYPWIFALAPAPRGVYVGGSFSSIGAVTRRGLGLVDAVSGAPAAWDPLGSALADSTAVFAILPAGETIYVGGSFALRSGAAVAPLSLAAFEAGSGALTPWRPGYFEFVSALGLTRDVLLVGDGAGVTAVSR